MKEQYQVPVAVFVFKRVELAEKMLKCLERIRPAKLFVISDGPRMEVPGEQEQVEQVRALFDQVSWPCEIKRNYASKNMGCDVRVPSGISWVFEQVEEAVILEDDCIPTDDFFPYVQKVLEYYRDDPRVMMVAGSNSMMDYQMKDSFCFTARVYTWGWATWKRAWKHYTGDLKTWQEIQDDGTFARTYPGRTRHFVKKELDYYAEQGKFPWDYLWWVSCMKAGGWCVVPCVNLISNEGFGADATHTQDAGDYDGKTYRMEFPLRIPEKVERDRKIDRYDRGMNRPWLVVRALKRLLPG